MSCVVSDGDDGLLAQAACGYDQREAVLTSQLQIRHHIVPLDEELATLLVATHEGHCL